MMVDALAKGLGKIDRRLQLIVIRRAWRLCALMPVCRFAIFELLLNQGLQRCLIAILEHMRIETAASDRDQLFGKI